MNRQPIHLPGRARLGAAFATLCWLLPCQAQTAPKPETELAAVIAVEEQQGDLAKAEALYRQALGAEHLSAAAKRLARQRLVQLLRRLGRDPGSVPGAAEPDEVVVGEVRPAEAAQDPERQAELRRKAAELLDHAPHDGLTGEQQRGLEWLGEPIVPEILARLPKVGDHRKQQYAALLWRIGGPQAAEFLRRAAGDPATPEWLVTPAWQLHRPEMMAVAEAFLAHPNFAVVSALLHSGQNRLVGRIDASALLGMAERGDAVRRLLVLRFFTSNSTQPAEAARLVALVQQALAATDPTLGAAAQELLRQSYLHTCLAGIELYADQQASVDLGPTPMVRWPFDAYDRDNRLRPEVAARLWPRLLACAQRHPPESFQASWAREWLALLAREGQVGSVAELLPLVRVAGPRLNLSNNRAWDAIAARMQVEDVRPVLEAVRAQPEGQREVPELLLHKVVQLGVPPAATMQLLALAPGPAQILDWLGKGRQAPFLWLDALVSTGHDAAWSILLAYDEFLAKQKQRPSPSFPVRGLIRLAHLAPSAERCAVLRQMVPQRRDPSLAPNATATALLLALLQLGDEPALALIDGNEKPEAHPLAPEGKRVEYTPLAYLFAASAEPSAHRYTEAQLTVLLQRLRQGGSAMALMHLAPHQLAADTRDDHVRLLAAQVPSFFGDANGNPARPDQPRTWCEVGLQRWRKQNGQNGWAEWLAVALEVPLQRYHLVQAMTKDELLAHLPQLRRWAEAGEDANHALDALVRAGQPPDLAVAIASPDSTVRHWAFQRVVKGKGEVPAVAMVPFLADQGSWSRQEAAQYFGKTLATEAVPGLIALLRDESPKIRELAEQALTRIRFYHEQQAHWDRVLRGLDASPLSALEKLLLQARPDAPKAQRLLAIPSLGVLGQAEALPFLIEWSSGADAEVAAAAKAAITQIHLQPRR